MGNFIPNEKVHECLICHNFYGMRTRLWNHVESEHNITKDEYMWKYVYEHDGEPKCIECGKSIHYNKWNRDILFCSVSCILTYNHRVNPGLWIDNNGNYKGLSQTWYSPECRNKCSEAVSEALKEKWKDPDYRELKSNDMRKKRYNYEFVLSMYEGRGLDMESIGQIYLVKYNNVLKLGFSLNFYKNRSHGLGNPEVIRLITFKSAKEALHYEIDFHNTYPDKSLYIEGEWNSYECYPLSELENILKI